MLKTEAPNAELVLWAIEKIESLHPRGIEAVYDDCVSQPTAHLMARCRRTTMLWHSADTVMTTSLQCCIRIVKGLCSALTGAPENSSLTRSQQLREAVLLTFCDPMPPECERLQGLSTRTWQSLLTWLDTSGMALYFLDRLTKLKAP